MPRRRRSIRALLRWSTLPLAYVHSIGARTHMIILDPPVLYAVAAVISACGAALAGVIWAVRRKP